MKKALKVLQWICFCFFVLMVLAAVFFDIEFEESIRNEIGYKAGLASFFGMFAIGFLLKLTGLQQKIKIIKKSKIANEIIYWFIICVLSCTFMVTIHSTVCEPGYIERLNEFNKEKQKNEDAAEVSSEASAENTTESTTEVPTESTTESPTEMPTVAPTESPTEMPTVAPTESPAEPSKDTEQNDNKSIYSKLSDKEFKTSLVAKSFYSFSLDDEDYTLIQDNKKIKDCLEAIYNYANENAFMIDPEYNRIFAKKYDLIKGIKNYKLLEKRFEIGYRLDNSSGEWLPSISSYSVNTEDVVEFDGVKYIDAEGYLKPGVNVYTVDGNKMCKRGKIKKISYDKEIGKVVYPYAIKVEYIDDPYGSGWKTAYSFFRANKDLTGEPAYYVKLLDVNRRIQKETINYDVGISWTELSKVKSLTGKEVYLGSGVEKAYKFTIIEVNKEEDIMLVKYESGNIEEKSYSALIANEALFVK